MSKKVCMFVWNHFTNDARVLRECSSLAEAGYEVDLIAIHDGVNPELPKKEYREEGFTVTRVNNGIQLSNFANRILSIASKNIGAKFISALIVILGLWKIPLFTIAVAFLFGLLAWRKFRVFCIRGYIALQMVWNGLKKNYDIYHSNDLNTVPQGLVCAKILRRRKLIYDSHEVQTSRTGYNSKIYGIMERFYLKFVDTMINENHTRAKYTEDLYGFYPAVVHNYPFVQHPEESKAVDLYTLLDIPREEPILLYQGGIQTGRGLEKIIEAIPMIQRGIVVFIGDGRIKQHLQELVRELHVEDRVKFIPKVPVNELLHYTRNAYLGFQVLNNVCFNHYSASSNKLFEYLMSGVPVVACSFPEIQRVVEGEYTGICVDSHDPASIAQGVNYLLTHPEEYKQMKANCFHAREKYNWQNEKKIFLDIYAGIC